MSMDLTSPAVVREIITRHGFSFTKSLGQNFITSRSALERMITLSGIDEKTGVLEIGPGIGTLTRELSAHAAAVAAVEIDQTLLPLLQETLSDCENVTVYHQDALKLDLPRFCAEALPYEKLAVCANLPYYITTPLVTMLLESKCFGSLTFLLQKEAVDRLCARPGDDGYCAASAVVRYYAEPKLAFRVGADCFIPRPKVGSAVMTLQPIARNLSKTQEKLVLRMIQAAFSQRRKTLTNTFSSAGLCTREEAAALLTSCGYREDIRGEALAAEDFIKLACAMEQ